MRYNLQKGFKSKNGQVEIVDEDKLCFIVRNISKGASGLRTISKAILDEYVEYFESKKNPTSVSAREDLSGTSEIDKFEYGYTSTLSTMAKMVLGEELSEHDKIIASDRKADIDIFELPLQIIYYGAPGTGKSYKIDNDPHVTDENTIRTTFHPDSDYSTFVGAYKPTMAPMPVNAFVGTTVHHAENADKEKAYEKKIVYKYVPQAFLKAYVAAWSDLDNPHFLVIEEINRGNCAQIFGDLFQLLDRNNTGSSSYAIHADEDIAQFLAEDKNGFANLSEEQKDAIRSFVLVKDSGKTEAIGDAILSGKKLLLPPNLYIWATMNTSDQSLFPIDSAFKRRWNWEYMPIDYDAMDWQFEAGGKRYLWSDFLKKMNPLIYNLTQSSDKQMGYFFAKADKKTDDTLTENNLISEKIFLNKVLFYLWTDVLKDFEAGDKIFRDEEKGQMYQFCDFFPTTNGKLAEFVGKLGLKDVDCNDDEINKAPDEETAAEDGKSDTAMQEARRELWDSFLNYSGSKPEFAKLFNLNRKPSTDSWFNFTIKGHSKRCHLYVMQVRTKNKARIGLSIRDRTILDNIKSKIEVVKTEISPDIQIVDKEDMKYPAVFYEFDYDFNQEDRLSLYNTYIEYLEKMLKGFAPYIEK